MTSAKAYKDAALAARLSDRYTTGTDKAGQRPCWLLTQGARQLKRSEEPKPNIASINSSCE